MTLEEGIKEGGGVDSPKSAGGPKARFTLQESGLDDKEATCMSTTQDRVGEIMNHIATEITIIVLVFGYLLLVFAILLFQEDFDEETLFALNVVDLIILCLFSVEISLKTFAFGVRYIRDWWNILDAVIVLISLVLSAVTMALSGNEDLQRYSRIRGVLRLLRVMVIFRRVSETRSSLHRLRQMDLTLATPLEKCTYLLARIEHDRMVPQNRRQDAKTVAETLARGDLFEPVQADLDDRDDLAFKTEASAWLSTAKQKTTGNGKVERSPTHFARVNMRREGIQHKDQSMLGEGGEGGENDDFFILTAGGDGPDSPMHSQDPTASKAGGALVGQELSMVPGAVPTSPLVMRQTMDSVDKWSFDVFALEELTDGHSLSCLLFHLSKKHSLTDALQLPGPQWRNLTLSVEAGYRKENSYHNSMHAADVLQGTYFLLTGGELSDRVKDFSIIDLFSLLMGAAVHDFDHPGVNNAFLCKTADPIAIRYNDQAVLENHHVASAWSLMQGGETNILQQMSPDQLTAIREQMITVVLGTDMSVHFSKLGMFKSRTAADKDWISVPELKKEDRLLLFALLIHAMDISNPARPLPSYLKWTPRVMGEFFEQGDRERALGLPVSMLMDRNTTNIAKGQVGFIDVIVAPVFSALEEVLPRLKICTAHCLGNKDYWQEEAQLAFQEERMKEGKPEVPALPPNWERYHLHHTAESHGDAGAAARARRASQTGLLPPSLSVAPGSGPNPVGSPSIQASGRKFTLFPQGHPHHSRVGSGGGGPAS